MTWLRLVITTLTMELKVYTSNCLTPNSILFQPIMTLKNTLLDTHVKPYKILVKDGIKIGVFGLGIELEWTGQQEEF